MGSLGTREEDDATERHRRRPVRSPRPWHQHRRRSTPEKVVNGSPWHPSRPSPRHYSSHLQAPISSPARYELLPPVNFDVPAGAHHAVQRRTRHAYFDDRAFGPAGASPPVHAIPPSMAFNYLPDYAHSARYGSVFPGHPYPGRSSICGPVPGYPCNVQQNQRMQYLPSDGHARPHIQPANPAYISVSDPSASQGLPVPSRGRLMVEPMSQRLPPHAIRSAGKTFRHTVTWSGMTMPVIVTSQAAAMVEWIQRQAGHLFGFDLEWKPNRCKDEDNAVSLLQICGPTDCLIIQLLYTDTIPRMLHDFLSNTQKQLGGVGIHQDVAKLEKDHDLVCQGQVELGVLASERLQRSELRGTGLKMLVHQVLGMTLVKLKKITLSNWEREDLDAKQIEYACIDAWAAYAVLHKLMTLSKTS